MNKYQVINQEVLKESVSYDPKSGLFIRIKSGKGITVGRLAGTLNAGGYLVFSLVGNMYSASHLAVLYVTGSYPLSDVDYRDNDKTNLVFSNLRYTSTPHVLGLLTQSSSMSLACDYIRPTSKYRVLIHG